MKAKPINIIPFRHSSHKAICEMSEQLRQQLGIPKEVTSLKITCGMHTVSCSLVFINEAHLFLRLSAKQLNELHLPKHEINLQAKYRKNAELVLGPIIALLTEIKTVDEQVQLGAIQPFCEELASYCSEKGILFYVFSLTGYSKDEISGYYFHQHDWYQHSFPLPHVVHNRIHSRKKERSKQYLDVISSLQELEIPYFNDRFLNKWEVHKVLSSTSHLAPYLPNSQLLQKKDQILDMLNQKNDLFIKPINGSLGKRIFRVKKTKNGTFHLDSTIFTNEMMKHEYNSFQQLYAAIHPKLKKEGFIVQETIPLKKYNGRMVDFRFLCHKKDYNAWVVSSAVARVSANNQIVSNIARGGEIYSIKEVLGDFLTKKESKSMKKMLAELSIEVVQTLSTHIDGEYGEFGVDLALDDSGHPWIIEVNTKPSKSQGDSSKVRPSAKAIIHYCLFLAHF